MFSFVFSLYLDQPNGDTAKTWINKKFLLGKKKRKKAKNSMFLEPTEWRIKLEEINKKKFLMRQKSK